jgi:hypothetical protein
MARISLLSVARILVLVVFIPLSVLPFFCALALRCSWGLFCWTKVACAMPVTLLLLLYYVCCHSWHALPSAAAYSITLLRVLP